MTLQSTIQILNQHLGAKSVKVVDKDAGILRCHKDFNNSPYQILYVDCSNVWLNEDFDAKQLENYQEKVLLQDYFEQPGSLQWNFYYAFITDKDKIKHNLLKKKEIEANDLYTRKLVLSGDELGDWLSKIKDLSKPSETILERDLSSIWINELKENQLDAVFLDETYVAGVDNYLNNEPTLSQENEVGEEDKGHKQSEIVSFIKSLEIIQYRKQSPNIFEFGKVNLIKGINGSGKTSLLEAIELILCGKSDRNPNSNNHKTVIKAKVGDDNRVLEYTPNSISLFKERDQIWYNNAGQKFNRLHVGFNKYNFYNTDAAHLLSTDSKKSNVKKAFEDIALGEEVNHIEIRLQGFYDRFYSTFNRYNKITNELSVELDENRKLIKELSDLDKNPDKFLNEVIKEADRLKWQINNQEPEKLIPLLEKELAVVKFHIQSIKNTIEWEKTISYSWIMEATQKYSKANLEIEVFNAQIKESDSEIRQLQKKHKELNEINELLQSLSIYFNEPRINELFGVLGKIKDRKSKKVSLTKIKQIIDVISLDELSEISGEIKLYDFELKIDRQIGLNEIDFKKLTDKKRRLEKGLNQLEQVISEIKLKGKDYVNLNPQATECPLCNKSYFEGELTKLIEKSRDNIRSTEVMEDLHNQIFRIEKDLKLLLEKKLLIDKIKQIGFLLYDNSGYDKTIMKLAKVIRRNSERLNNVQQILNKLVALQDYFEDKGLTEKSYNDLVDELTFYDIKIKDVSVFNKISESTKNDADDLKTKTHNATEMLNNAIERCNDLLWAHGIDSKKQSMQERLDLLSDAKESFDEIHKVVHFNKEDRVSTIEKEVDKFHDFFERYKNIKKQKDEYNIRVKSAVKNIDKLQQRINNHSEYRDRAHQAFRAIEELQKSNNKTTFLREFIDQNKEEISEIFKMIHSPKEFEYLNFEENGQITLKRKQDDEMAHLSEISTGQRSALALSIFSALNRKLKNGPNILMFDDPIANIDDLNILSYFDYLREVAVNGDRQIFFATANENAAFLFKQKFDFLGDADFKIIELSSSYE